MAIKQSVAALLLFGDIGAGPVLDRVKLAGRFDEGLGLIVEGKGFEPGTEIVWNGRPLQTTMVSETQMRAVGADAGGTGLAKIWARSKEGANGDPLVFLYEPTGPGTIKTRVWPNPWKANMHRGLPVTIHGVPKGAKVGIFTADGRDVKLGLKERGGESRWDPSKAERGMYLYQVESDRGKRVGMIAVVK